jgi:hypothetical protein
MATDTEITELTELDARKVSGVHAPANGTPWLLLKAAAEPGEVEKTHHDPLTPEEIEAAVTKRSKGPRIGALKRAKKGKVAKSPGVPAESLNTPSATGHITDTGLSGQRIAPMTSGVRGGELAGGESAYIVTGEDALKSATAYAVSSLVEAIDAIAAGREAAKADDPLHAALALVAQNAIEKGKKGKPWDDDDADDKGGKSDNDADDAKKEGSFAAQTLAALQNAQARISSVLAVGPGTAATGPTGSEEDQTMTLTLTKEELEKAIATGSEAAVKTALEARDAAAAEKAKVDAKAAKKEAKRQRKAESAKESANNNGEVSEGEMRSKVHGEHPSNDVDAVKETKKPKSDKIAKELASGMTETTEAVKRLEGLVTKALQRPRGGGPIMDGHLRGGSFPAAEGRTGDVAKGEGESDEITQLAKSLSDEMGKLGPEAAARAADLSQRLTLARLRAGHEAGVI